MMPSTILLERYFFRAKFLEFSEDEAKEILQDEMRIASTLLDRTTADALELANRRLVKLYYERVEK